MPGFQNLMLALAAALLLVPLAGAAEPQEAEGSPSGFFGNDMKSGGMIEGMDFGTRPENSSGGGDSASGRPVYHGKYGSMGSGIKKAPDTLVPEIERSNDYSVPVQASTPVPTPSPTATPSMAPEAVTDSDDGQPGTAGESQNPPGAEYYQQLLGRARSMEQATPKAQPTAKVLKPPTRRESYTF